LKDGATSVDVLGEVIVSEGIETLMGGSGIYIIYYLSKLAVPQI
jgi:hypothetical protein